MARAVATITTKSFVFALFAVLLPSTGCITTTLPHADNARVWYKTEATQEQMRADLASCRGEAERQRDGLTESGGMIERFSQNNRMDQIMFDCMTAKGYVMTNTATAERTK